MKNTFKMTSGKGVGKYCEKRCPGQTQHMFGPYWDTMDSRGHLWPRNNLQNRKKLSECVLNDHRRIRFKGRLWVIFRAFGASLWRPSAPTMAPMNRLWGALVLVGWAPRAPRDAPEHKLKKIKKISLFWSPKWMSCWYIFHQNRGVNDGNKIVKKNNAKLYDFLKKTRPEYVQLRNIKQVKNLNVEEIQCKANVRFTRGKQWF